MRSDNPHDPKSPREPLSSTSIVVEQREANEKLVLAGVRAQEDADDAHAARLDAESRATELKATTDELLATAEFRERIIGIIGHDLRNPLNTMIMACGLLISHGALSQEDARLVHRVVDSGHRMSRMIEQLVEFTRARLGGGFVLALRPSDLGQICENIAAELRISASAQIHVTTKGDVTGIWDADRLAEVVSNIAGNAVEHATPGTAVEIRVFAEGETMVTEIENHGPCIPPDLLPTIFTAFRRATAKANREAGHLGLGLYIANEIVRSHGGNLVARSSDETTTFAMRLPRGVTT